MNQKKAKRLQGVAEQATIGRPTVAYERGIPPVFAPKPNTIGLYMKVRRGRPQTLRYGCTRHLYKTLKRQAINNA